MSDDRHTICQLVHGLPIGGTEVLADRFVRCLSDRFRFVVACLDHVGTLGEALQADGYTVQNLDRKPGLDWRCARRLAHFIREQNVTVVHAHQYTPFFYALMSRGLRGRVPIVFTEHGRWHPDYPRRKRMIFNRVMSRRRDRFLAVGGAVRQALIANEGLPKDRVRVVYNGISLEPYEQPPSDRAATRAELGFSADDILIIQVARLDGLKDHLTAIRAMQRVVDKVPHAKLILVGEGPERSKIEAAIAERGLEGTVHLLGSRRDVPRLLFASDLFLLTSISEGIPLTIIEGMAAGLPIVSTDVGGVGEILGDPPVGRLASASNDRGLAEALIILLDNSAKRVELGDLGRKRAFHLFSEQTMHARYTEIFEEVMGRSRHAQIPPGQLLAHS